MIFFIILVVAPMTYCFLLLQFFCTYLHIFYCYFLLSCIMLLLLFCMFVTYAMSIFSFFQFRVFFILKYSCMLFMNFSCKLIQQIFFFLQLFSYILLWQKQQSSSLKKIYSKYCQRFFSFGFLRTLRISGIFSFLFTLVMYFIYVIFLFIMIFILKALYCFYGKWHWLWHNL